MRPTRSSCRKIIQLSGLLSFPKCPSFSMSRDPLMSPFAGSSGCATNSPTIRLPGAGWRRFARRIARRRELPGGGWPLRDGVAACPRRMNGSAMSCSILPVPREGGRLEDLKPVYGRLSRTWKQCASSIHGSGRRLAHADEKRRTGAGACRPIPRLATADRERQDRLGSKAGPATLDELEPK